MKTTISRTDQTRELRRRIGSLRNAIDGVVINIKGFEEDGNARLLQGARAVGMEKFYRELDGLKDELEAVLARIEEGGAP